MCSSFLFTVPTWIFSPHSFKDKNVLGQRTFFFFFLSFFLNDCFKKKNQALRLNLNRIGSKLGNELKRFRLKDGFLNGRGLEYKCAGENAAAELLTQGFGGEEIKAESTFC